jgi:hypothetical protein
MLEQYCQQVSQGVVDKYGFTVPWELILEIVMELIDKCMDNEEDFVQSAKSPTLLQRVAMNVYVRRVLEVNNRKRVVAISETIFGVADDLSEEQLAGAFVEAQTLFQGR